MPLQLFLAAYFLLGFYFSLSLIFFHGWNDGLLYNNNHRLVVYLYEVQVSTAELCLQPVAFLLITH